MEEIRRGFSRSHWNALRVELGAAGSVTSREGARPDSARPNQAGGWLAISGPWWKNCRVGQLSVAGKSIGSRASADSDETGRFLTGIRLRGFWSESFSLSVEAAHSWSRHSRASPRDEEWNHYAAVIEWYVPQLGGWLAVAYGGDTAHHGQQQDQVSLRYALSRKAILGW